MIHTPPPPPFFPFWCTHVVITFHGKGTGDCALKALEGCLLTTLGGSKLQDLILAAVKGSPAADAAC